MVEISTMNYNRRRAGRRESWEERDYAGIDLLDYQERDYAGIDVLDYQERDYAGIDILDYQVKIKWSILCG